MPPVNGTTGENYMSNLMNLPPLPRHEDGQKESLPELVAASIRQAVFDGLIGSGVQLKQNDVAATLGVSPVPVREALKKLAAEGLLITERNKGVVVAPLSLDDFAEITDLRVMLEPYLLRCSAPHLTGEDLDAAEKILQDNADNADRVSRSRNHWEFHRLLYSKARRPRSLAQIDVLYVSINRYLHQEWMNAGLSEHWFKSHFEICAALRNANVALAAELITEQIENAAERVRSSFGSRMR